MTRRSLVPATVGGTTFAQQRSPDLPVVVKHHRSLLLRQLVTNLRIAAAALDGLVIAPGETFSFCRTVGGGICQAANLLHWMVLHSPLTITERSEHSFDPFPDSGRVIPWGTGCSIFYNYVDLQFRNDTAVPYQIRVWIDGQWWRSNEVWRRLVDRRTGNRAGEELVKRNRARMRYDPTVTYPDRRPGGRL